MQTLMKSRNLTYESLDYQYEANNEAISNAPPPKNVAELKSFFDMVIHLSRLSCHNAHPVASTA